MAQGQVLRHVVMFGFKPDTTPEQVTEIERRFVALREEIDGVVGLEWGTNVSPEGLNKEQTHCFFLTFETEAARDAYLPHPAHKAFVDFVGPHVHAVTVMDYWARTDSP